MYYPMGNNNESSINDYSTGGNSASLPFSGIEGSSVPHNLLK